MKLIHLSDLHLGKRLEERSLLEEQEYILFRQILPILDTERPDALLDLSACPDLAPVLFAVAAAKHGAHFTGTRRLRYKESDRLQGIAELLNSLGGCLTVDGDGLLIHGVSHLQGGTVDPMGDHRLAMSAALAALSADAPVTVRDADCVSKSYPAFWADFQSLKGEAPCPAPSETPSV